MQINCLHCGHRFDLGKAYDDYEGAVRCSTCRGLLDIRTQDGQVRGVRLGGALAHQPPAVPASNAVAPASYPVSLPLGAAQTDAGPSRLAA